MFNNMIVSFNFSGSCKGEIINVYDTSQFKTISVVNLSNLSIQELREGFKTGKYLINFKSFLSDAKETENEIFDIEVN